MGWKVEVDKKGYVDEDGKRLFEIKIIPKGKKCSPEELREKRDLIDGFAISILRDIIYARRPNEFPTQVYTTWRPYLEDKKDMIYITYADVFVIRIDMKNLIKLEIENRNLSKKAIGISLTKWYEENLEKLDKIFVSSDDKARSEALIKYLEDNGMPKATREKKSFLDRFMKVF